MQLTAEERALAPVVGRIRVAQGGETRRHAHQPANPQSQVSELIGQHHRAEDVALDVEVAVHERLADREVGLALAPGPARGVGDHYRHVDRHELGQALLRTLVHGAELENVEGATMQADPTLREPLAGAPDYLRAEAVYAARYEMVHTLDDVLSRLAQAVSPDESSADQSFADRSFDVVVCQQGLQFFPDRLAAMREMR